MTRSSSEILDEWLVLRCQAGEVGAVRLLVSRWHPRLYAHSRRLLDRRDAADDATQESWLAIVRGIRNLEDPARFGPWAYAIVTHKCRDALRKRRRDQAVEPLERAELSATPHEIEGDAESPNRVREAMRALSPSHRAAIALHHLDGMSLADIAIALDVPVGTVKSRLHHARERLRAILEFQERTSP